MLCTRVHTTSAAKRRRVAFPRLADRSQQKTPPRGDVSISLGGGWKEQTPSAPQEERRNAAHILCTSYQYTVLTRAIQGKSGKTGNEFHISTLSAMASSAPE
jgi:hypothetical protein